MKHLFMSQALLLLIVSAPLTSCIPGNGFSGSVQRDKDGNITGFTFNPTQSTSQPTPQPIFTELPQPEKTCREVTLDDPNGYLKVRNDYGHNAEVMNVQLNHGDTVELASTTSRMGYVRIVKPVEGYVSALYLTLCQEDRGHG